MALIVQGGLAPTISGKVGNVVFARGRGGAIVRNFVKPVNPQSDLQTAVRSTLAGLSAQWNNLVQADHDAWSTAAAQSPQPNRVGLNSALPPLALFQKVNIGRVLNGLDVVTTPPSMPLTLNWDPAAFSVQAQPLDDTKLVLNFNPTPTDDWTQDAGNALLVYLSPPLSQGINFYKGKYNAVPALLGNSGTPPTSPHSLTLGTPLASNSRYFYRGYVTYSFGNLGAIKLGSFDTPVF